MISILLAIASMCTNDPDSYAASGLYDKALPLYETAWKQDPTPTLKEKLAKAYFETDQPTQTIELLKDEPSLLLGLAYQKNNQLDKAIETFQKVPNAQQYLGIAYYIAGDYNKAADTLKGHDTPFLAKTYLALNQPQEALKHIKPEEHFLLAEAYYLSGQYLKAIESYQLCLKGPEKEEALLGLGWSHAKLGRTEEALKSFKSMQPTSQSQSAQAQLYIDNGKLSEAQTLLQNNPTQVHYLEGLKLEQQGQYLEAAHAYKNCSDWAGFKARLRTLDLAGKLTEEVLQEAPTHAELDYLKGWVAYKLGHHDQAQEILSQRADLPSKIVLGLSMMEQDKNQAEKHFASLECAEGYYWAAKCNPTKEEYRSYLYSHYPHSSYAAETYFAQHPFRDYLQGDKKALRHLEEMPKLFPHSNLTITAHYLLGINQTRDRKSSHGRWIQKTNELTAIEHFQAAENLFHELNLQDPYSQQIYYKAKLERGLTNLSISQQSTAAKKQIYLDYAIELFTKMQQEWPEESEPTYWLAQAYLTADITQAEKLLSQLQDSPSPHFKAKAWYHQGLIHMKRKEPDLALTALTKAESPTLNSDEHLDILIQKNYCYQAKNDLDQAMFILSSVINESVVSAQRLRAMFLRAEIYEKQERRELARKQLEAIVNKGGEWALKAKEKLEKEYAPTS